MYMFFWFFKQFYYLCKRLVKHKFLLLLVFFIIALLLFFKPVKAVDITIPDEVITYAKNHTYFDNYIILQDTNTGIFYVPIPNGAPYEVNAYNWHGWLYAKFTNGKIGLATPDWYYSLLYKYQNNQWVNVPLNQENGRSRIQLDYPNRPLQVVYATKDIIYQGFGNEHPNNSIYFEANAYPFITNNSTDITKWTFNNLNINGGSMQNSNSYGTNLFSLQAIYDNVSYLIDIDNFKTVSNNSVTFSIPYNYLLNGATVRNGKTVTFSLLYYKATGGGREITEYNLGSYTFDLTTTEEEQIQQNMSEQLLGSINNNIQNQTNAINNQTNAINNQTTKIQEQTNAINEQTDYLQDDNINNNSIYLPQDNSNDITQDGLNGIFTTIYNAFCTGQAQDIVFPIPFTNKNITLQPNYVRSMLTNSNANWIITIIEAFWWYIISRYIIKDITNKITKIKSGNIEDIETSNIKGDML